MEDKRFAGPLIRLLRLQNNWSQETLCHGICTVSYLSKIEQGKVEANEQLISALLERLGATWEVSAEMMTLRDELYEGIFSHDQTYLQQKMELLEETWDSLAIGPCYADFVLIRAFNRGAAGAFTG